MRLIDADALMERVKYSFRDHERVRIDTVTGTFLTEFCSPTVDAVEVVRCARCKHGIWDEEEGLWLCVFTADYDEELGVYHGFIQHNTADYYCADGEQEG